MSTQQSAVPDFTVDHLIIGAGVIGLAVAERLSRRAESTTLLAEKNARIGEETSSRNSEVIHTGLYYPTDSLKARLCIEGKQMLYDYCRAHNIPHASVGKWVVAQNDTQCEYLHRLQDKLRGLGVPVHLISSERMREQEPHIKGQASLVSPTTGIIDTHSLMGMLQGQIGDNGGDIALNTKVSAIWPLRSMSTAGPSGQNSNSGYLVSVETRDPDYPIMTIKAQTVINAAGLWSDSVARMPLPPDQASTRLYYAKGRYYSYSGSAIKVSRLIYPVPDPNITTLGTHLTIDLGGRIKFGPDLTWTDSPTDYAVTHGEALGDFVQAISTYLPAITAEDLHIDYAGIRPKLQPPGGPFCDFVIRNEVDKGLPGFINLLGIESPGLTASLAIAKYVECLLY